MAGESFLLCLSLWRIAAGRALTGVCEDPDVTVAALVFSLGVSVRACQCSNSASQHHSNPNFTEKNRQAGEPHLRTELLAIGYRLH